ncbi:MAG TPA: DUF5060 domain-containing protein [Verrucomicrobiae bacterium]|nr:DUF5060 domain-containing protein [Verrucomicrobiae bacterium]
MTAKFLITLLATLLALRSAELSGELKQWHKVTLTFDGPFAHETNTAPNPFRDFRFTVEFKHSSGAPKYRVPGYFAADGNAGETSARSGNKWRVHLSPDKSGQWTWRASFEQGPSAATDESAKTAPAAPIHNAIGSFEIAPTDKSGRDFRSKGRLEYVGKRYLQFAGSKEYFLKAGADSPENLLAYADFDDTFSRKKQTAPRAGEASPTGLHRYEPHARDWRDGDPTWKNGRGKNLIGALNYLAGKGANSISFLTYNVSGDGDDVWPFVNPTNKFNFDCSKLDQWQIVFDHAQHLGLHLHFKLQETEMDDNRNGGKTNFIAGALDQGDLGPERKLYLRELIARFGYQLALNWNLGEENTQSSEQQRAMAKYIADTDPYRHNIVVHTYPDQQDRVYPPLLGAQSVLTGVSLQNGWDNAHQRTLKWITESTRAGRPWVVANDEQNPADLGVPPDPGYRGHSGHAPIGKTGKTYNLDDIRKHTLWGTLLAGGAGVEYYFGYTLPENDLNCEDWRSRDKSWDACRIALEFFRDHKIPFWEMTNADELIGNPNHDNTCYCFAKPNELYLVYLPTGGECTLNLSGAQRDFSLAWFNPREGGPLQQGAIQQSTDQNVTFAPPSPADKDWLAVIRRK